MMTTIESDEQWLAQLEEEVTSTIYKMIKDRLTEEFSSQFKMTLSARFINNTFSEFDESTSDQYHSLVNTFGKDIRADVIANLKNELQNNVVNIATRTIEDNLLETFEVDVYRKVTQYINDEIFTKQENE